jgi:hypothetical protein
MVMPTVASELTKIAIAKLSEIRPDDVARAARAIGKAAGTGSMLIPGLGVFGAGLLVGTGIGYLTAPRAGAETRERLVAGLKRRIASLRRHREEDRLPASEESVGSRNGGTALS